MSIRGRAVVVGLIVLLILTGTLVYSAQVQDASSSVVAASPLVDPNQAPSEFNHHLAGYALIGVGLLVLVGLVLPRLRAIQLIWPFLFVAAGIFLAVWSDAEIWPRGNMSWTWLLHHDVEALQHKLYAVLLIALGVLEYLRYRGFLSGFWRIWSFPMLAILGASLLLVHDHTGSSGVHSPEAKAYLVNPALDFDGKPWPVDSTSDPPLAASTLAHGTEPAEKPSAAMDHAATHGNSGNATGFLHSEQPGAADPPAAEEHAHMNHSPTSMDSHSMPMSHGTAHVHHMTPSNPLVEREHFWFMVVGLGIAMFKFLSDMDLRNRRFRRFIPYLWPSAIVLLGVLLTMYRE